MKLRLLVASIIIVLMIVATAVSFINRPPEPPLLIDGAQVPTGQLTMICRPMVIHGPQNPKPITRT